MKENILELNLNWKTVSAQPRMMFKGITETYIKLC
jgi:hypothetical protein